VALEERVMAADGYLMHKVVADRLREVRAAAAGRAMLRSRAASGGSLASMYLDRWLLAFEYAGTVMAHRTAVIVHARLRQTVYDHVVALGPAHVE
jgi:hypothetical protein